MMIREDIEKERHNIEQLSRRIGLTEVETVVMLQAKVQYENDAAASKKDVGWIPDETAATPNLICNSPTKIIISQSYKGMQDYWEFRQAPHGRQIARLTQKGFELLKSQTDFVLASDEEDNKNNK